MTRLLIASAVVLGASMQLAAAQKKILDHSVYDGWKSIRSTSLTDDGKWLGLIIAPQEGDPVLHIRSTSSEKAYVIDQGSTFRFSGDSKFAVITVSPKNEEMKKARRDKVKPEDMPKTALLILNLETGDKFEKEKVTSYLMAEEDMGWVVYRPEPPRPTPAAPGAAPGGAPARPAEGQAKPADQKPKKKTEHRPGETRILRELATGKETTLTDVANLRFNRTGSHMVVALSTKDGEKDGVVVYDLAGGKTTTVAEGLGRYNSIVLSNDGSKVAFLTDRDDYAAKRPTFALHVGPSNGATKPMTLDSVPKGWSLADSGNVRFSESGARVFVPTRPTPPEEVPNPIPEEERVSVDLWSWTDPLMMPQQLLQAGAERNRTFDVMLDVASGRTVRLADEMTTSVSVSNKMDGQYALASSNRNYRREISWGLSYTDYDLLELTTGERARLLTKFSGSLILSPTGRFAYGFDRPAQEVFAIDLSTGKRAALNQGIPHPVFNEISDVPDDPGMYGFGGWMKNDEAVVIYDRFDAWQCDPTGKKVPIRLTFGRETQQAYRLLRLDPEQEDVGGQMYASVTDQRNYASGIYRIDFTSTRPIATKLIWGDKRFGVAAFSKKSDRMAITRQDFVEFPDVWLTDKNLSNPIKVTDANPQQKEYNWGKAELVYWRSNDGEELTGILIKPEDFDYGKKYPMIAYFYERDSDTVHGYRPPAPSASTINLPMYASNGYLIFIPDIPYKNGYPGESAVSAITSGVNSIVARGYVDPKRLAIQGQSWGGYQVAYLITETNMFRAACAGAPVSNMFSAYGGIRWGSGLVRQMQYEKGQSRIDGTIWDKPLRYLENSPLFFADKIQTPLLMMANDKDGAVPWYQGIEFFAALRRLEKPVWMAVYNDEDHNLIQRKNRKDWSIRMQQFFDHYLKDAPAPKWMVEGIPATEKGKTMGFELVGEKKGG
jgi:dipeptidyl aminopeptidase/acylaminoacyl peptidase